MLFHLPAPPLHTHTHTHTYISRGTCQNAGTPETGLVFCLVPLSLKNDPRHDVATSSPRLASFASQSFGTLELLSNEASGEQLSSPAAPPMDFPNKNPMQQKSPFLGWGSPKRRWLGGVLVFFTSFCCVLCAKIGIRAQRWISVLLVVSTFTEVEHGTWSLQVCPFKNGDMTPVFLLLTPFSTGHGDFRFTFLYMLCILFGVPSCSLETGQLVGRGQIKSGQGESLFPWYQESLSKR